MKQEYGPRQQFGREFGDNRIFGDNGDEFFAILVKETENPEKREEELGELVDALGWSEGCPVEKKVKKRYAAKGTGNEGALYRYGEVITARMEIYDEIRDINPRLYQQLTTDQPMPRLTWPSSRYSEPVGEHEADSVPQSHLTEIDANNTPWGYAIPRMFLAFASYNKSRTPDSSYDGLKLVEAAADPDYTTTPLEFLVMFGSLITTVTGDPDLALKSMLSKGYLKEENTFVLFKDLLTTMQRKSPKLWKRYCQLSSHDKDRLGITQINFMVE